MNRALAMTWPASPRSNGRACRGGRRGQDGTDTLDVEDVGFRAEGVGQVHVRVAFDAEERTIYMSAPRVNGGVPVSPKRFALEILREAEKRTKTWPIPLAARIHTVATHVSPRARVALILMGDVEAERCPT